jgi:hypothetical protein
MTHRQLFLRLVPQAAGGLLASASSVDSSTIICVISHENILPGSSRAEALPCGHVFHTRGIRRWWEMMPTAAKCCAICKHEVVTESSDEDDL